MGYTKGMIHVHFQEYCPLNILRVRIVNKKVKVVAYSVINFFPNYSSLQKTFFQFFIQVIYWYSALGPVWAETRVQSGDWYGSGTLHPGQVLRGSLPLFSPAF